MFYYLGFFLASPTGINPWVMPSGLPFGYITYPSVDACLEACKFLELPEFQEPSLHPFLPIPSLGLLSLEEKRRERDKKATPEGNGRME